MNDYLVVTMPTGVQGSDLGLVPTVYITLRIGRAVTVGAVAEEGRFYCPIVGDGRRRSTPAPSVSPPRGETG